MITIIIILPILVVIQIGVGVGIGAFLLLTIISIISSITLCRLYLIQTHIKNKTGIGIASTLNVTENLPATELENRETHEDLSNQDFEITDNDPNYSAVTSFKHAQCIDKFPPVHNEVERKKKSYASDYWDGSHSATVMKKTFTNAASSYEEIDLTPRDVSVQKETQGSETWDPSHIYSAVNKKSTKTAVKKTAVKSTRDNCLIYAIVDKKKPKVPPRSRGLDTLELNDPDNEMYSNVVNSMKKKPQLELNDPVSDTCDPNYSAIDKKTKPKCQVTDYIPDSTEKITFEQEEEAPEIPPFDLSMMYPVD